MHRPICEEIIDIYRDRSAYHQERYYKDLEKSRAEQRERKKREYLRNPQKFKTRGKAKYAADPEAIKAKIYGRRKVILEWFIQYCQEKQICCSNCGETDAVCLDFHHLDQKQKAGSIAVGIRSRGWSEKKVLKEMERCSILCANCHRKHHYKQTIRCDRKWLRDYKSERGCGCGEKHPACLDFHHKDKTNKMFAISEMMMRGFKRASIFIEIEKCDLLCANCHRKEHAKEQFYCL